MRHRNPKSTSYFSLYRGGKVTRPYLNGNYTYEKATPDRVYVKVVKYVAEHPNCKRVDILHGVWDYLANAPASCLRGQQSSLFACLLYKDFIDYNYDYEYTVTSKGLSLLKRAGVTELNITKTIKL